MCARKAPYTPVGRQARDEKPSLRSERAGRQDRPKAKCGIPARERFPSLHGAGSYCWTMKSFLKTISRDGAGCNDNDTQRTVVWHTFAACGRSAATQVSGGHHSVVPL